MSTTQNLVTTAAAARAAGIAAGWREITLVAGDQRFHAVEAGDPDAPLLLLLHGFPEFWYAWRDYLDFFAELGFHVVAPDQRGYNLSDRPRGARNYVTDKLAADALGMLDVLGAQRACVIGHDWGGHVAWALAERYPERVEKMVILNVAHPRIMVRNILTNPRQMLKSWYGLAFQLPWIPELVLRLGNYALLRRGLRLRGVEDLSREDADRYIAAWSQPGALTTMLNWYRGLLRRPAKGPQPRITVPTLLLWGALDQFLDARLANQSIALCERGELVRFERGTHWLHHEEPAAVKQRIATFLRAPS